MLSRRDFKEADRSYCILTSEYGKIECLARGGHKPLAKLTPHLETAAEVELLLVQGQMFHTIAGVERRRRFVDFHPTLSQLLLFQNSLALVDLATRPCERDPALYQLVVRWLEFVQDGLTLTDERAAFLLGSFTLKLMSLVGYCPELSVCLSCHQAVESGAYRWHALKGGVVCEPCVSKDQEQWFQARRMDDATLKLLRLSLQESFSHQMRPTLSSQQIVLFHDILESYLICHFPIIPAVSMRGACRTSALA